MSGVSPWGILIALLTWSGSCAAADQDHILNASFDVSRELYRGIDAAFAARWKAETGREVVIQRSHAGSSQQARSVRDGLAADVVTLNQPGDIDFLVAAHLVAADWRTRLPFDAAPYTSATAFIVEGGNPKGIHDWADLVRPGIRVALVNPKLGGNGRYTFLAAWAYALEASGGDEAKARSFVTELYSHAPVLAPGGRAATTAFAQNGLADVLITFESEAPGLQREIKDRTFEIVSPSVTLLVEFPVAIVDAVVDRHGTRAVADAYLRFLYSAEGQRIIAENGFRPRTKQGVIQAMRQGHVLNVREAFGGWANAQKRFFDEGALFDQIAEKAYH